MAGFIRKIYRRPVRCEVDHLSAKFAGHGTVVDISKEGLRIEGTHTFHTGMRLALVLRPPGQQDAISIDCAYVRWSNGRQFGVRFQRLHPETAAKLCQLFAVTTEDLPVSVS